MLGLRLKGSFPALAAGMLLAASAGPAAEGADRQDSTAGGAPSPILETGSFWRFFVVRETEEVALTPGKVEHVRFVRKDRNWFRLHPKAVKVAEGDYKVEPVEVVRLPKDPPADWMRPDFDDSTWARVRGPMFVKSRDVEWKTILARGRFEVTDPARAGDLALSVVFRGGLAVYLNGKELARSFMPRGPLSPVTPAEPYPLEVYLDEKGYLVWPYDDKAVYADRARKRVRRLENFRIPASRLRRGVNVLALAVHRAPALPDLYLRRIKRYPSGDERMLWSRAALISVRLAARSGSGVVPNTQRLAGRGFRLFNQSIIQRVRIEDYPDPFSPLAPIRLAGVRNGTFAGQVVLDSDTPIKGLKAEATALVGPAGRIDASAVRVRYGVPDGSPPKRGMPGPFDSLEETPPEEVPVHPRRGGAVLPVWITVAVPREAAPGEYRGKVTVRADGIPPTDVPLELKLIDWTLPDPKHYTPTLDIIQSPESVAMAYKVPLWSEEHLRLLEKTFSLLAPLAARTLYITAVRRTHFGNEHAMVRWVRGKGGDLEPDFSIAEKYLETAMKHVAPKGVIFYVWEPTESMGHAGGTGTPGRTHDRPILISVKSARSGRLRKMKGPAWGTPECREFWRRFNAGVRRLLEKHGLGGRRLFGLIGDNRPTKVAMDDVAAGAENPRWAVHSHHYCDKWNGYEIGFCSALWGIHIRPLDPAVKRTYGWQSPFWLVYYPREMSLNTTLVEYRVKLENWMGAGSTYNTTRTAHGLGRIGADFWPVLQVRPGRYKSLAGRYPESYWGQLNLNYCIPHLLGRGRTGPVATVRSEMFRENVQEMEARIFIEKALLDKAKRARLGEDLARRCRQVLDERIRFCLHAVGEGKPWFISSGWNRRNELLFRLAAEVARKLGG